MKLLAYVGVVAAILLQVTPLCAADAGLQLSVTLPRHGSHEGYFRREVERGVPDPHFHVILTNTSNKPQRLYREWCEGGYYSLSFELTDEAGKTWTVRKKQRGWIRNYSDWWELEPQESLVIDVHFSDTRVWEGFPPLPSTSISQSPSNTFTMRAIYENKETEASRQHAVWIGRIVSKADSYVFDCRPN